MELNRRTRATRQKTEPAMRNFDMSLSLLIPIVFIGMLALIGVTLGGRLLSPDKSVGPSNGRQPGSVATRVSVVLGFVAVVLCGIPFVPPLVALVIPAVAGSLFAGLWSLRHGHAKSIQNLIAFGTAAALNLFALYLAFGGHHLIDWLEGH